VLQTSVGSIAIVALCALAGCVDASSRTTAQIDSASFGRLCITSENTDRPELSGCWPISAADAAGLEQGDCIDARIPDGDNDPVTDIRVLDRECHVGVQSEPSTSNAIQFVLWLAGLCATVVFFAVILPRLRRRRALARELARRKPPATPTAPVEIGETTEVTVIDVSELGRHRSDD
jgi:hypothetical protein